MRKEYYFIAILILLIVVLFGFGSNVGLALQGFLRGDLDDDLFAGPIGGSNLTATISNMPGFAGADAGLKVNVYSQYPLNLKNQLSIAAGRADGIAVGDVAMVEGHFLGFVEETFERSALVQTIFDKRFQAQTRIGATGADALLRGGSDPKLTLIPGGAAVSEGDGVYIAADGAPYGAPIGSLKGLRSADDHIFQEAQISVPYNPAGLKELTIVPSSKR